MLVNPWFETKARQRHFFSISEIYNVIFAQVKDWESKHKSQELLRKKEQRTQANNSEYFYQRCLTLERKIIEMEVDFIL